MTATSRTPAKPIKALNRLSGREKLKVWFFLPKTQNMSILDFTNYDYISFGEYVNKKYHKITYEALSPDCATSSKERAARR